ncbi:MAG: hypothetical protein J5496_07715 [Lachnospiraceae bacterium]|nr:hypothetical protein [Lachnospiraceae bacterium]
MGNFFNRLGQRFRQFMVGRYGTDNLSRFMLGLAFFFMILNIFLRSKTWIFSALVWILLILVYLRMLSRNIQARYNENTRYLMVKEKVLGFFGGKRGGSSANGYGSNNYAGGSYGSNSQTKTGGRYRSDAEHRIFRCPKCTQRVRVPRGRGMIEITCPRCGNVFRKRS